MGDAVVDHRLRQLEEANKSIAKSLETLVRLEQHHADTRGGLERAWREIERQGQRLQELDNQIPDRLSDRIDRIEDELPTLKLTSRWVLTFTLACAAAAGALVWNAATDRQRHDYILPDRRSMPSESSVQK